MTSIEVEALLPATPLAVWHTLLEYNRWPEWCAATIPASAEPAIEPAMNVAAGDDTGIEEQAEHAPQADQLDHMPDPSSCEIPLPSPPLASLDRVELLLGPESRVGALRRCAASFNALPLFGRRAVHWTDQLTDAACPWTLEFEILDRLPLRRCRLRFWLMEHPDGQTRLRLRLKYSPAPPLFWLLDHIFLRRTATRYLQSSLSTLAKTFEPLAPFVDEPSAAPASTLEPSFSPVAA